MSHLLTSVSLISVVVVVMVLGTIPQPPLSQQRPPPPLPPVILPPPPPPGVYPCPNTSGTFRHVAVASDAHTDCPQVGVHILRQNGSVVDAAIATMLCTGAINFQSCGIGGGHTMTIYIRKEKRFVTVTSLEVPPRAATYEAYQHIELPILGGPAIGVPGEVRGMWEAHQLYGKLEWKKLFEPTIRMCRQGYRVAPAVVEGLAHVIGMDPGWIQPFPGLTNFLWNNKTKDWYKTGEIIKNPRLADTLEKIAEEGADAFYNGSLTEDIVADIRDTGGNITAQDLKDFRARVNDAISLKLSNGLTVHTPPLPSGGPLLLYILNILDGYNYTQNKISGEDQTVTAYHRMIEAFKYGFAVVPRMGDPEFVPHMAELMQNLTDSRTGAAIRECIDDSKTYSYAHYKPAGIIGTDHGTSHLSIVAPNGDAVAMTSSIRHFFGSKILGKRTGILFNDILNRFATINRTLDDSNNRMEPGKMPFSAMAPSIIVDPNGDVTYVIGASGGLRLPTVITYILAQSMWFNKSMTDSIRFPRIHHSLLPEFVEMEKNFPRNVQVRLESMGHIMNSTVSPLSRVQCIMRKDYGYSADADPRKCGSVDGW